MYYGVIP